MADDAAPDTTDTAETADTTDTDETGKEPEPFPWSAEGFWDAPGALPELFTENPAAAERLRIATSEDGVTWNVRETPVAWGISSLSLFVVPDEGVIVTGLLEQASGVPLDPGVIYAVVSADLETWGSVAWEVGGLEDGLDNLVDPSLSWSPRGELQIVYYATTFQAGDPVFYPGDHKIRRAIWQTDLSFHGSGYDLYAEEELADPVTCRIGDTEYLFVTRGAEEVRAAVRVDGAESFTRWDDFSWTGRTVPYCREEDGGITVVAQTLPPGMRALEGRVAPDGTWSETRELLAASPFGGDVCASVGVARLRDTWLLVCVETNE